MALKQPYMVKNVVGTHDLQLTADVGKSLLVKGVYVKATTASYVTLRIEKTTVGYFRVAAANGNHLNFPVIRDDGGAIVAAQRENLLDYLYRIGIFKGYPVGEGERFVVMGADGANDMKAVVYEEWDAGDKKPEDPNGSKSKEYFFINYGDTGASIILPGDRLYNTQISPVEFPAFPFGADVPAKTEIVIHGICGKEVGVRNATPATAIYSRYLKLVYEREVLFDSDRNGLLFDYSTVLGTSVTRMGGGLSVIGNFDHLDPRYPLLFPEPLVFSSGEELNIYMTTVEPVDGSFISQTHQVIGLIETVKVF